MAHSTPSKMKESWHDTFFDGFRVGIVMCFSVILFLINMKRRHVTMSCDTQSIIRKTNERFPKSGKQPEATQYF